MFPNHLDLPSPEIVSLWKAAEEYTKEKIADTEKEFELSKLSEWNLDQGTSEIVFSDHGVPKVKATFTVVGSLSLGSGSWLWAWANPDVENKEKIEMVRKYGEDHKVRALTEEESPQTPEKCFELASVSAYVLKEGVPIQVSNQSDGEVVGYIYLVISDIAKVE